MLPITLVSKNSGNPARKLSCGTDDDDADSTFTALGLWSLVFTLYPDTRVIGCEKGGKRVCEKV